jgi:hypothetical protein
MSAVFKQHPHCKKKRKPGQYFWEKEKLTKVRPKNDGRRPNPAVMLTCPLNWPNDCIPACQACNKLVFNTQRCNKNRGYACFSMPRTGKFGNLCGGGLSV